MQTETTDVGTADAASLLETSFGNEQPIVTVPYPTTHFSDAVTKSLSTTRFRAHNTHGTTSAPYFPRSWSAHVDEYAMISRPTSTQADIL